MANEPGGATPPESRPEGSANQSRNPGNPVPGDSTVSRGGQPDHPAGETAKTDAASASVGSKPSGYQIQPATHTVARTEASAAPAAGASGSTPAKPCPTDSEGRLIESPSVPVTTTEGVDAKPEVKATDSTSHDTHSTHTEEDNPYHQEQQTDHHHDDYHHDDYHHDHGDHYHDDPYHRDENNYGDHGSGGGWVPPSGSGSEEQSSGEPEEEEGGGPVKGFLDHLEDLRWVLIKCSVAIMVCMVICLIAGDKIVSLLKYPLEQANNMPNLEDQPPRLHVQFGTNQWFLPWDTNQNVGPLTWGTNIIKSVTVEPVVMGTNVVLTLKVNENAPKGEFKHVDLTVLSPMEAFSLVLDIALYGGLGLASPFVFFFLGQFILPALRQKEKKWLYQAVSIGAGLFIGGVLFCYFIVMGVTLYASAGFAEWMGFKVDTWRATEYISFMLKFLVGMGISFELPVVLLTLVKVGILNYERLANIRSYMIVILLVISGFITPSGDPFSMVLMALPLYVLYEISILVAYIWHKRELREQAAAEKAEAEAEKAERDRK